MAAAAPSGHMVQSVHSKHERQQMTPITWTLREFRISDLKKNEKNPKTLSKKQYTDLKSSVDKFGMVDKPCVNADAAHSLINGHQRIKILEYEKILTVPCWYPSRELTPDEMRELGIRLEKNKGSLDMDMIANNFDVPELIAWGFEPFELGIDESEAIDLGSNQTQEKEHNMMSCPKCGFKFGVEK
jgi:hypothetical protein